MKSGDGENWTQVPSGTEIFLRSITGNGDASRLWAAGDKGTILESADGQHWRARTSGSPNDLRSVFVSNDGKHIWAVGARGTILNSTDGEHWRPQASGTQNDLQSIFGDEDGSRLWAVGAGGTILESRDSEHWDVRTSGTKEYLWSIFRPHDKKHVWVLGAEGSVLVSSDGENWSVSTTASPQHLTAIFGAADGSHLWAAGNNGIILKFGESGFWNAVPSGAKCNLRSLTGTKDGKLLWAVGEQRTILRSQDGEHWRTVTMAIQNDLTSIFGTSDGSRFWAVGEKGTVLQSSDGEQWRVANSGTPNDLRAVFGTPGGKPLWAVGVKGTILRSDDGEHWTARPSGTSNTLDSVFATADGRRVWIVGEGGMILTSSGDGDNWDKSSVGQDELVGLFGLSDGKRLWAVGANGAIVESRDGGQWKPSISNTDKDIHSIFGTADGKRLWAVGAKGTILVSNDGEHWAAATSETSEDLVSVFGTADGRRLWAVGRRGTILQSDDGDHWNARNSSALQDFLSLFTNGDGNRVWAAGVHGIILQGEAQQSVPVVRQARIAQNVGSKFLELRLEKTSPASPPVAISVRARNDDDYLNDLPWRALSKCSVDDQNAHLWQCGFQPAALRLKAGQKVHFLVNVQSEAGTDSYGFTTVYDPMQWIIQNSGSLSIAAALLLFTVLPSVLLIVRPLWNLKLYRALGLGRIEQIKIPVLGDFLHIATSLVTVLPWFVKHTRTLDAWIREHRDEWSDAWRHTAAFNGSTGAEQINSWAGYIPLPVRLDNGGSGLVIEQPTAADIRKLVKSSRTTIQIIGPGGAGKTTLARQVSEWAIQSGPGSGLSEHPMLPIWVDEELDSEKKTLSSVVKGRLVAALPDEPIEDLLFSALLKKQRLLIIVDRLSERSQATQRYVETVYRSISVGFLVTTSRTKQTIDGAQSTCVYPQPLNSATLLNFMTGLLAVLLENNQNAGELGVKPFSSIEEQLELGKRLAGLIRLHTEEGETDVPLGPLVVRLFVEQAVKLLQTGKTINELPLSLPDVYFRHLRQVNPDDPSVPHFVDADGMLRVAKILGRLALGSDFIPREFSKEQAVVALTADKSAVTSGSDPVVRLILNGVLLETSGGLLTRLRFTLDPVAEFLAAAAHADECGSDSAKWDAILASSSAALGFQGAFKLVRQAYAYSRIEPERVKQIV